MAELKYDPRNYRIHTDKNKRLIRKSLEDCGAGRSILFDKDDCIIAGNGVYEQALELGLPVRIVESDGTELIAIKRTDLSTEDSRRKALALADNYTSDTSVFDFDAIVEDFSADEFDAWEFKIDDLNIDDISIDDVAKSVGVSRSHLYRVFMLNVGKSPIDYLTEYRINEACKLLRAGSLSIAEVAVSVGFFDQFYFSRVFKRAKGVPPSKYLASQTDAPEASE